MSMICTLCMVPCAIMAFIYNQYRYNSITVNQEIFMYENLLHKNLYMLNVHVNKISWAPTKKLTQSFVSWKLLYLYGAVYCCMISDLSFVPETVKCRKTPASTKQSSIARFTLHV